MKANLYAYTEIDGIPTFRDSEVKELFTRMASEGNNEAVFYDGDVKTAGDFLNMMKRGYNQLFLVFVTDGSISENVGFIWLNGFEKRRAAFHFCFFRSESKWDYVKIGKQCVFELLHMEQGGENLFDILTGIVPETNKRAQAWCEKMGFSVLGTLPSCEWIEALGKSVPATVYYVERGSYG